VALGDWHVLGRAVAMAPVALLVWEVGHGSRRGGSPDVVGRRGGRPRRGRRGATEAVVRVAGRDGRPDGRRGLNVAVVAARQLMTTRGGGLWATRLARYSVEPCTTCFVGCARPKITASSPTDGVTTNPGARVTSHHRGDHSRRRLDTFALTQLRALVSGAAEDRVQREGWGVAWLAEAWGARGGGGEARGCDRDEAADVGHVVVWGLEQWQEMCRGMRRCELSRRMEGTNRRRGWRGIVSARHCGGRSHAYLPRWRPGMSRRRGGCGDRRRRVRACGVVE
jgi:hypothetical protein